MRIILLLSLSWVMQLTAPLFTVMEAEISGRDLILILGGFFLLAKSTTEIHGAVESGGENEINATAKAPNLWGVIIQIALIDVVFSLDSVITAVGLVDDIPIMIAAVIVAIMVMMIASGPVGRFVHNNPTIKMLALSFLVVIGVLLTCGLSYAEYRKSTEIMSILLGPATVALAVPLYLNLRRIRQLFWPIFTTLVIGGVLATGLCVLLGWWFGAEHRMLMTMAPKSVTSPIAMLVAEQIGGRGRVGRGVRADHRRDRRNDRPGVLVAPGRPQPRGARYGAGHDRSRRRHVGGPAGKRRVRRLCGAGHESDGRGDGGVPAARRVGDCLNQG